MLVLIGQGVIRSPVARNSNAASPPTWRKCDTETMTCGLLEALYGQKTIPVLWRWAL